MIIKTQLEINIPKNKLGEVLQFLNQAHLGRNLLKNEQVDQNSPLRYAHRWANTTQKINVEIEVQKDGKLKIVKAEGQDLNS
jgi:hypothetical protein